MTTAENILSLSTREADKLFPGDEKAVKAAFKSLAKAWHPDTNGDPRSAKVFQHLILLRDAALNRNGGGRSAELLKYVIRKSDGTSLLMKCHRIHKGDFGNIIVGRHSVAYEYPADWNDLAAAEEQHVRNFEFADKEMRKEFSRFLAAFDRKFETVGGTVLVYRRPTDTVLLADLMAHCGRISPVHAAWIVSSMINLACYVQWAGFVHGAISPENLLVCPEKHSLVLVGGWGYATEIGKRPKALPRRTVELLPRLAAKGQTISTSADLELIKLTAQEILGAPGGGGMRLQKGVPMPLADWLAQPAGDDAIEEYERWNEVLKDSFGPRRFVNMGVKPADIYK